VDLRPALGRALDAALLHLAELGPLGHQHGDSSLDLSVRKGRGQGRAPPEPPRRGRRPPPERPPSPPLPERPPPSPPRSPRPPPRSRRRRSGGGGAEACWRCAYAFGLRSGFPMISPWKIQTFTPQVPWMV